jgi:hypothetical protein
LGSQPCGGLGQRHPSTTKQNLPSGAPFFRKTSNAGKRQASPDGRPIRNSRVNQTANHPYNRLGNPVTKRTFFAIPATMLAFSGLALAGVGVGSGVAQALPCSNDVTDVDYCGRGGGGGGGHSPFGTGPGQIDLTPGVTQNGPTNLTPGAGTNLTPGAGSGSDTPGIWERHLAVDCPQPYSQTCAPRQGVTVYSNGPVFVTFSGDPSACAPGNARIFADGKQQGSAVVQPGQSDGGYHFNVAPGVHLVEVQMDGILGGCNTGAMSGWSGNLHVETG